MAEQTQPQLNAPNASGVKSPVKKKWSQERAMLLLIAVFIFGVVVLTLIPEEHPLRPFFMPIFITLLAWAIFKK